MPRIIGLVTGLYHQTEEEKWCTRSDCPRPDGLGRLRCAPTPKVQLVHGPETTKAPPIGDACVVGAPGAIRTPGPQIRSLMLYPAELRVHGEALLGPCPRIRNPYFAGFVT